MPGPRLEVRAARASDLAALAAFVAETNARAAQRCLHCAARLSGEIRAVLRDREQFPGGWEAGFYLASDPDGEIAAAFGCQVPGRGEPGYLWGPWWRDAETQSAVASELHDLVLDGLRGRVPRVDAFLGAENQAGLRFLRTQGFTSGLLTHIYVAPRTGWSAGPMEPASLCPPLRVVHEVAFARLHVDTFPTIGTTPAAVLLDDRDEERAIFAATENLRLLGSICVSVNHAPQEGFIDYLAVKESARGRGVGTRLLRTALHWAFETQHLPQLALTVSDGRASARRLYEQTGFMLQASGIAARRML